MPNRYKFTYLLPRGETAHLFVEGVEGLKTGLAQMLGEGGELVTIVPVQASADVDQDVRFERAADSFNSHHDSAS